MTDEERKLVKETLKNTRQIKEISESIVFIRESLKVEKDISLSVEEIETMLFEAIKYKVDEIKDREDYKTAMAMRCITQAIEKQLGGYDWRI